MLGYNHFVAPTDTPAQAYAAFVAMESTDATSFLAKGCEVMQIIEPANGNFRETDVETLRALLLANQFQIDMGTNVGGTYAGKLKIANVPAITVGGAARFATAAQALNSTYYQVDQVHQSIVGTKDFCLGGDTPQFGIAGSL